MQEFCTRPLPLQHMSGALRLYMPFGADAQLYGHKLLAVYMCLYVLYAENMFPH